MYINGVVVGVYCHIQILVSFIVTARLIESFIVTARLIESFIVTARLIERKTYGAN